MASGRIGFARGLTWLLVVWGSWLCASAALAAIDVYEFKDEAMQARYQVFVDEMRCPKCQNQNLAGSDSAIASDLRRELYRMLTEGKTDDEIVEFMVARYGEFILYKPRLQSSTYLLWWAPLGLLGAGALVFFFMWFSNRKRSQPTSITPQDQARLDALLKKTGQDK